jgi:uncharacterized Ntn-hydrolase superfamily protein
MAGVGAVATQAQADISYGYLGLELMAAGKDAARTLKALMMADSNSEARQVAMVDSRGNVAVHTGTRCIPLAGDFVGSEFSCQANFAKSNKVWKRMGEAYTRGARIPFPERLVQALEAGQEAGGDIRGQQSAAIMIVSSQADLTNSSSKLVDLRVEDHAEPIEELKRLLKLRKATDWNHKAIKLLSARKYEEATKAYERAKKYDPKSVELEFWTALCLVCSGNNKEKAQRRLLTVFESNPEWIQVTRRLEKIGLVKLPTLFNYRKLLLD